MIKSSDSRLHSIAGIVTIVVACVVVAGWILNFRVLTSIFEGYVTMKVNTALLFILSGICMLTLTKVNEKTKIRTACAGIVILFGALTLSQYVFGWELGIDQFFFRDNDQSRSFPGRMSPATAINFVLLGACFLTINVKRLQSVIQIGLLIIFSFSVLAIIVNDFTIRYYDILPLVTTMSIHTASLFLLMALGVFCSPLIHKTKFNLELRLAGGFLSIVSVVIITFFMFTRSNDKVVETNDWIDRAAQSLNASEQLVSKVKDVQLSSRDFIDTHKQLFLDKNHKSVTAVAEHLNALREINARDTSRTGQIDLLEHLIGEVIVHNKAQIELHQATQSPLADSTNAMINEMLMQQINNISQHLQNEDLQRLHDRRTLARAEYAKTSRTIMIFQVLIILVLILVFLIIRSNTKARNSAERDLQNSRERFSQTLSSIGDAIIATDNNSTITFMNHVAQDITGWKANDAIGKPLESVFAIINEKTRAKIDNPVEKVLNQGKIIALSSHSLLVRRDSSEIAIEESGSPILDSDRNITGAVLVFRDVTARKANEEALRESEEKFEKAFQASGGGISITRMSDTTYLDVNESFIAMTGYSKEELIGRSSVELAIVTETKLREKVIAEIKSTGSAKNFEMKIRQKSGESLDVLCSVQTILLKNELYGLNIIYDITERKKSEAALESANKELEAFSYSISHDLRAPLRSIRGFSAILEEDYGDRLDQEGKRVLETIGRNAAKMNKLIDDLLEFSRVGRSALAKTDIDTGKLVTRIIEELNVTSEHRANIRQFPLIPMYADTTLITQVWINLISNAIKYSVKVESPQIEIGSRREGQQVLYYVKDNGAGFDMLYVDKLFGVFQRLHRSQEFEGTGIGLSIVKRIIMLHGGKVWAEGAIGKGATFYFQMPNAKENGQ